jgi:hypothetical protein
MCYRFVFGGWDGYAAVTCTVYETLPWNLQEQRANLMEHLKQNPEDMPENMRTL